MGGEYYRADILARAGLPVDQPILASTLPGEQVLVYRRRDDPRFADVLRALDERPDAEAAARAAARAVAAEAALNDRLLEAARATLRPISPTQSEAEPIHRLFHRRLVDPRTGGFPGGRLASFYVGQEFRFPRGPAGWEAVAAARPVLNGRAYGDTIGGLLAAAHDRLSPARLADAGGVVAHGDAHNANVWYERGEGADRLSLFDPAFAGDAVPSLLAEVKATFHNALAHPFWLYDPSEVARRYAVSAFLNDGRLVIDTDWEPGPLRQALLDAKADRYWAPWLAHLAARGLLPPDWERVMRLALFLCPTLVMSLRSGPGAAGHTPESSALGLAVAIMAGTAPVAGEDVVSRFFDRIRPSR